MRTSRLSSNSADALRFLQGVHDGYAEDDCPFPPGRDVREYHIQPNGSKSTCSITSVDINISSGQGTRIGLRPRICEWRRCPSCGRRTSRAPRGRASQSGPGRKSRRDREFYIIGARRESQNLLVIVYIHMYSSTTAIIFVNIIWPNPQMADITLRKQ